MRPSQMLINAILLFCVVIWTIPTLGLFITSFRPEQEIRTTGWWTIVQNPTLLTLENYQRVIAGTGTTITDSQGNEIKISGENMGQAFLNSFAASIPATIIPILIALFAAYGFAWMEFPGRKALFVVVISMLVVPIQISLIPILNDFTKLGINGTFLAVWLIHAGFGLSLSTYLLFNYIRGLPKEMLEAAFVDGASHFTIFYRLVLPLSLPAIASFAIFQFLWVWNDLLVAMVFLGGAPEVAVLTLRLRDMVGARGQDWHLLTAGAFIVMVVPLLVFFSLQRFFVRGLLAGSVKG